MSGNELFYRDKGEKQDSDLHDPIILAGFDNPNDILKRAKRLGLNESEIKMMFPAHFTATGES